jgi:hypothetical protein
MQSMCWRLLTQVIIVVAVTLLVVSFSASALAEGKGAAAVKMFRAATKEQTNIAGVSIVADRPKGFNALTASSAELGRYGLPQRPDAKANAKGFAQWTKAMQALRYRAAAHVTAKPYSSTNVKLIQQSSSSAVSATPTSSLSYNWSGVANTNNQTRWNNSLSIDYVQSTFNVPTAQPPIGACKNGITGSTGVPGFYEVSWNGIDGFSNGDVLQGGSLSYADCGGRADDSYIGWVEWFPSYPILEIDCQHGKKVAPCPVRAGDQMFVVTYGANSTTQFVFMEDATQGWYGTFGLAYLAGPSLVGSSAEQIIERPCCNTDEYPVALANYIADSFNYAWSENGAGKVFAPGEQGPKTALVSMVDDGDTQDISDVDEGSQGFQGYFSLFYQAENCAYQGGCTPF